MATPNYGPRPGTTAGAVLISDKIIALKAQCAQEGINCIGLYLGRVEWNDVLPLFNDTSRGLEPPTIHGIPLYQVANVHSHWNAVAVPLDKLPPWPPRPPPRKPTLPSPDLPF